MWFPLCALLPHLRSIFIPLATGWSGDLSGSQDVSRSDVHCFWVKALWATAVLLVCLPTLRRKPCPRERLSLQPISQNKDVLQNYCPPAAHMCDEINKQQQKQKNTLSKDTEAKTFHTVPVGFGCLRSWWYLSLSCTIALLALPLKLFWKPKS